MYGGIFWWFEAKKVEFFYGQYFDCITWLKKLWTLGATSILELFLIWRQFSAFLTKLQMWLNVVFDNFKNENKPHPITEGGAKRGIVFI